MLFDHPSQDQQVVVMVVVAVYSDPLYSDTSSSKDRLHVPSNPPGQW